MRNCLFEIKILALCWNRGNGLNHFLPEGATVELATAIRAWYEALHDEVRTIVRCVEVHPSVSPENELLHVAVTTCGFGGESNVGSVPSGKVSFIYNWATRSVRYGAKEQISLIEALDRTLLSILSQEMDLLNFAKGNLEEAIAVHAAWPSNH